MGTPRNVGRTLFMTTVCDFHYPDCDQKFDTLFQTCLKITAISCPLLKWESICDFPYPDCDQKFDTLFQTCLKITAISCPLLKWESICDFPYPGMIVTKSLIPYFRPALKLLSYLFSSLRRGDQSTVFWHSILKLVL